MAKPCEGLPFPSGAEEIRRWPDTSCTTIVLFGRVQSSRRSLTALCLSTGRARPLSLLRCSGRARSSLSPRTHTQPWPTNQLQKSKQELHLHLLPSHYHSPSTTLYVATALFALAPPSPR